MRSPAIDVVTSCSTDGSVWPSLRMSRRVQRSHGEFVFVGKGATDFRAASRFKSGELRAINMSSNKIQRMLGLAQHSALVSLDLSHNNIQAIEGIEGLASLQVLRLHHNHLTSASGLEPLEQLHVLDLNNNDLTSIAELRYCAALTELDVSCNALAEVDDISSLGRLSTLSVRGNLLKLLDRLPYCLPPSLQTLDLAHNSIGEVSEIQNLASLHNLESVDLSENVFVATASQHGFSYRPLAAAIIPALQTLDGEAVTKAERSTAEQLFNGSGRRNRLLLEVGQEAALLTFLAERCPASVDSSPDHGSSHRRAAAVGHAAPLLGRARAPPTAEQFAELEQQVKEMRRYFKQYVKTEARKRDRATRVLQACVLGHVVRKEFGGRLLSRGRSTGRNDDGRQIELPPPRYDSGADAWRGGASGPGSNGRRAASQQGFDADRYQLVHPAASPRRGLDHLRGDSDRHARHVHVGRRGSDAGEEHRAAQLIQARQRGLIARRRLADFQDCKHSAVRIQVSFQYLCTAHEHAQPHLRASADLLYCPSGRDCTIHAGSIPRNG
jgi:hypothetical protein